MWEGRDADTFALKQFRGLRRFELSRMFLHNQRKIFAAVRRRRVLGIRFTDPENEAAESVDDLVREDSADGCSPHKPFRRLQGRLFFL